MVITEMDKGEEKLLAVAWTYLLAYIQPTILSVC